MKNTTLAQTNRRQFLRIIGGVGFTSAVAPGYIFGSNPKYSEGVLIEAASFNNPGGWKIDTQHYHQMGGSYLLAHGMGEPVEDATTSIELPESGKWHVWVRNRDWCKGKWESPGRFQVAIDGKVLKTTFGAAKEAWHWQNGGTFNATKPGKVTIALKDLTGFDGRCDAIFLTKEESASLPEDVKELTAWKDHVTGRAKEMVELLNYDVVIVGGGMTGCGAALAAKEKGLKVALIQDRPLFGGNASQEIRVHTLGIHGYGNDILKKIDTKHYPNGHDDAIKDQAKREASMAASGVDLYAHHMAIGLSKKGKKIESVEAREVTTGLIKRFNAPVFIDASGDGWLAYWSGCEYRYGRESHKEFGEYWDKHGDLWSPEKADNRVMGTSVLWEGIKTTKRHNFPDVPWATPVANGHEATGGEWFWEYSHNDLNQIDDAEQIRDHVLRAIFGSFSNAKQHPKNATWKLHWVAYVGGKRESRRIIGDHIYSMKDATEKREFEDAVVVEKRDVDTHYQRKLTGAKEDFLTKALFYDPHGHYFIPFRSLYAKDVDNLMIGGRCFSCTHIGLAGPRVMNTCAQMGVATGYAAVLCKKHGATPKEVGKKHIKELRNLIGFGRKDLMGHPKEKKKRG